MEVYLTHRRAKGEPLIIKASAQRASRNRVKLADGTLVHQRDWHLSHRDAELRAIQLRARRKKKAAKPEPASSGDGSWGCIDEALESLRHSWDVIRAAAPPVGVPPVFSAPPRGRSLLDIWNALEGPIDLSPLPNRFVPLVPEDRNAGVLDAPVSDARD